MKDERDAHGRSMEQWARDVMEKCGWEGAQACSAGEVVYLANLLNELSGLRRVVRYGSVQEGAAWNIVLTEAEIGALAKGVLPTLVRPENLIYYAPSVYNEVFGLPGDTA